MTDMLPTSRELAPMTELSATSEVREADPFKINIEGRLRPVDENRVRELAQSIKETAQIQPVLCRFENTKLKLVSGAHRVAACRLISRPVAYITISKTMIPEAEQAAFWTMMELDENLFRHELSPEDRKEMMGLRGENLATIQALHAKANGENTTSTQGGNTTSTQGGSRKRKPANQWYIDWHGDGKIMPVTTADDWWRKFRDENKLTMTVTGRDGAKTCKPLTPSKAKKPQQEAFFAYLRADKAKAQAKAEEADKQAILEAKQSVWGILDGYMADPVQLEAMREWFSENASKMAGPKLEAVQ